MKNGNEADDAFGDSRKRYRARKNQHCEIRYRAL